MEKLVLDTNIFFNLQEIRGFGETTKEVVERLTKIFKKLKEKGKLEVYVPPSVKREIQTFFDDEPEFLKKFFSLVIIKSPERNLIKISSQVFYDFVKETRERFYRGLKIAEEEILKAGKIVLEKKPKDKIEFEKSIGTAIKSLRERYRNATRTKFLDSPVDTDLILLAKEIGGFLISTDEGVILWAEKLGIKTIPTNLFKQWLENLC